MKKNFVFCTFLLILGVLFCSNKFSNRIENNKVGSLLDTISDYGILAQIDKLNNDSNIQSSISESSSARVIGDWTGTERSDTLFEHYYSQLKAADMISPLIYISTIEYDSAVVIAQALLPVSYLTSNNNSIDTLFISDNRQLFGLFYLNNEGDLVGDGGDELGFVIDYADWSYLNTYNIVTNKNGEWYLLYSFPI